MKVHKMNFVKKRKYFPPVSRSIEEGLLAVSEYVNAELLLEAYSYAIFPWPFDESPILWFSPEQRGVLFFKKLRKDKKLLNKIKKYNWRFTWNRCFDEVIAQCAKAYRPGQAGSWITQALQAAYKEFHKLGYAHSLEVWEGEDLVGGLYGVYVGDYFSAESMFFLKPNASKAALYHLIESLRLSGHEWLDIQMVTDFLKKLGGEYVTRQRFLSMVKRNRQGNRVDLPIELKKSMAVSD